MGNPIEYNPLPSGVDVPSYYTRIDAVTDAFGNQTNFISPNEGNVTITGITDAAPATGSTVRGGSVRLRCGERAARGGSSRRHLHHHLRHDLNETDSNGKELYSWSVTLDTDGLAQGVLRAAELRLYPRCRHHQRRPNAHTPSSNPMRAPSPSMSSCPSPMSSGRTRRVVTIGAAQTNDAINLPNATSTVQLSTNWTLRRLDQRQRPNEEDLQTGATIDLTAAGASGPALATDP